MVKTWLTLSLNDFEKKVQKTKIIKKLKKKLRSESETNIMDILSHFSQSEPTFS